MTPGINSTDWSTSYSQYLAKSAAISARTLNLYQLALDRVSQGKLPPTVFQDYFPSFVAARSGGFANQLAEVASRFLSDLTRLSLLFSQPGSNAATEESEIVPPQFDPSNPARWYEQVAEYAGQLSARAVKTYRAQLEKVAAGETTPSEVQQQTAEKMAQQLPDFMQSMTQICFNLLNGLNDIRSAYEEAYFGGLLGMARTEDDETAVTLTLTGPLGTTSSVSLAITNTTARRTRIHHQTGDVRRIDGVGSSFVPAIEFVPEALELDPAQEGTITLSLQLNPNKYDSDALYSGALLFTGGSDVPLEVKLCILATATATKESNGLRSA